MVSRQSGIAALPRGTRPAESGLSGAGAARQTEPFLRSGEKAEVEAQVLSDQREVATVLRDNRGPDLSSAEHDQQGIPESRRLGAEVGFVPTDPRQNLARVIGDAPHLLNLS